VHRKTRDLGDVDRTKWTNAELLWNAAQGAASRVPEPVESAPVARAEVRADPPMDPAVWEAEHATAFAQGERRTFVAATTLAHRLDPVRVDDPGLAKQPRDLELPPWNKGRYGTAIGRAVHATLQTVDLATGAGIAEAAAAQAAAEGVLGHEETIAALAHAAVASPTVVRAAARAHWRETYVAVPVGDITLEGYIDLVFRDDDGLVVVDYKTDAVTADDLAARLGHYRVQVAAYALALAAATGEPVARCVLTFLAPDGAQEVEFRGPDLAAAVGEVEALAARERADPSPLPPLVPADP
jgi:hypothetical protein